MSETYVDVVMDDDRREFRAELRRVDTGGLILARDWHVKRTDALADAHALRRDDDRLAAVKKQDLARGSVPPWMRGWAIDEF